MTLRALAMSDVFKAGVAQYGFVHSRMMTLEGMRACSDQLISELTLWKVGTLHGSKSTLVMSVGP